MLDLPLHSQARVLPSHAIKTRRGRSTLFQAHVLPPHAVKTRGGRSTFYHGHGQVHLSTKRLVTSMNHSSSAIQVHLYSGSKTSHHSNAAKPTSFPYCSMIAALHNIQKGTRSKACILHKLCMSLLSLACIAQTRHTLTHLLRHCKFLLIPFISKDGW